MRRSGFIHKHVLRASIARWLLIIATGSAATACSGNTLGDLAGKMTNTPPRQTSPAATAKSEALLHAGDAAREKGDLDAAITKYAAASAADLARQDEAGASSAYRAAQKLAPKNPEAAFRLGEIDLTHGDAKAAADQFATALATRTDDPKLYNAMGVALAMQGNYAPARDNYDKGLALAPDYPSLRNNYGLMQLATGDLPGALATFSALVVAPQATDRYRRNRALVELAMGQTEAALADAPGMDESGLRQTLAIYQAAPPAKASADAGSPRVAATLVDSDESPLQNPHLAVDSPVAPAAVMATTPASIQPAAGVPPTASN